VEKIDLKKQLKHLYQLSAREVVRVDVPAFRFLMIDGAGDPNTSPHYARAVEALFSVSYTAKFMVKKGLAAVDALRVERFTEGPCAQVLHVGPFSEEGPTIQRVHDFVEARGALAGKHHEIYLSDIRRADPARWKTIIRQPMA